ncbi:MAG TPA: hypothetical protein VF477_00060, partial [Mycobacterium sp.]
MLYLGRTTGVASDDPNRALVLSLFNTFATEHGLQLNSTDPNVGWRRNSLTATDATATFIAMSVKNFKLFVTEMLIPNLSQIEANLRGVTSVSGALPLPTAATTSGNSAATSSTMVRTMVRTGTGSISLNAGGDLDLTDGPVTYVTNGVVENIVNADGSIGRQPKDCTSLSCSAQLGGVAVYTVGHLATPINTILPDPETGALITVTSPTPKASIFSTATTYTYSSGGTQLGTVVADTVSLTGGGDITVTVQGDVLSRRDMVVNNSRFGQTVGVLSSYSWIGASRTASTIEAGAMPDQPWRVVDEGSGIGGRPTATISTPLFREGIGALGGGNVTIDAGGNVSDITVVSETSLASTTTTLSDGVSTNLLLTVGGGNVTIRASGDILANRVDVASGTLQLTAGGNIGAADPIQTGATSTSDFVYRDLTGTRYQAAIMPVTVLNETRVRIDDATVDLVASGDITLKGIGQLDGFYSPLSELNLLAGGSVTINNNIQITSVLQTGNGPVSVYPGTLNVTALTGEVDLKTFAAPVTFKSGTDASTGKVAQILPSYNVNAPSYILMAPSTDGQLSIMAAGDILPSKIAMLDIDPNYLPGLFTLGGSILYTTVVDDARANRAYQWDSIGFPSYKSTMSIPQLLRLHMDPLTQPRDDSPIYIYAGGD